MEGQTLGNRYELLEKIGGGGMALVYKARCKLLNRFVAVKILRPEFTNDEEFVKRFRIEAQSAASLSHPNIVSIYDVGHDENTHYIIMEYIDGITLKEYISNKGVLGWKEAVNISIQICSAIEHAHRNHIIHRDIKPHNILITREGVAKVTDFGIARAVSSSTITMVGSTIGSVHYFSPEQARGGFIDEKSDLYSLGIALYEMVTGKVPFDGETPVAIALKHIQDEAMQPIDLDASIPSGVNDIILRAIKKEQNKRYQTATEFLADLYRVLREPFGQFEIENSTDTSATRRVQAISEDKVSKKDEYRIRDGKEDDVKKGKKKDTITYWLAGITSVVIITVFVIIGYKIVMQVMPEKNEFVMEDYSGQSIDTVKSKLLKDGFQEKDIQVKEEPDDNIAKGYIISQNPSKGTPLKPDGFALIELVVSNGPDVKKLPDMKGKDPRQAEKDLNDLGFQYKEQFVNDETMAEGRIIRTEPVAYEEVKRGETVTVYISKGPEIKMTKVPNLVGKTQKDAVKLLLKSKLVIGKTFPEVGSNFVDKIIKQEPVANIEIKEGDAVDIYFEENNASTESRVFYKEEVINLNEPEKYGDDVKLLVEITPSDTKKTEILINVVKKKATFPATIKIPVPKDGTTNVKIYLNNELHYELTEEYGR